MGIEMDKMKALSLEAVEELRAVFSRITAEDTAPFLEALKGAKRIFLLSAGREGLATRAFAMRLMHLGREAHWIWDDTAPAMGEDDLLVCASGSGDTGHELYLCRQAKTHGTQIALVTASDCGRLLELADLRIKVPAAAYKATGAFAATKQMMGNLFEQALLIFFDVVVRMLAEELGITEEEMEARHRNVE